jgi:nucleotide-binding universal stress UspA family protein
MKKVLIAIDYDQTAQKVAREGFLLAKEMNAKVILLHVISNPVLYYSSYMVMSPFQINSVAELEAGAQKFLEKIKKDLGDETIETIVKEGETSELVLETAIEMKSDIIVIGTHSRKWLENIIMGSVAQDVLRKLLCRFSSSQQKKCKLPVLGDM